MSISFGKDNQQAPTWTARIAKIYFTTPQFDDNKGFYVNLLREGDKYDYRYSAGKGDGLVLSEDGTEILEAPAGWKLSEASQGAQLLNSLDAAQHEATGQHLSNNLRDLWGAEIVWETKATRSKDSDGNPRKKPFAKTMLAAGETTGLAEDALLDEAAEVLGQMLISNGGTVDLTEISPKSVKSFTNGMDYVTREQLVAAFPGIAATDSRFSVNGSLVMLAS